MIRSIANSGFSGVSWTPGLFTISDFRFSGDLISILDPVIISDYRFLSGDDPRIGRFPPDDIVIDL